MPAAEPAASYLTLEPGTPVVDRFGAQVGKVERVLTKAAPFFHGLIVNTRVGSRFVDAPEVWRIHTDRVELAITCADCEAPGLTSPVGIPEVRFGRTDVTDADTRVWWGEQYAALLDAGAHGFWHDMNEPTVFSLDGEDWPTLATRHAMEGRGGSHVEARNLYGMLMARAAYEGLRRLRPDRRPWLFSRSGWAGLQRYSWAWTGDTVSSWPMWPRPYLPAA